MQPTIHLERKPGYGRQNIQVCFPNVLWVAFSNSSSSLSLMKYTLTPDGVVLTIVVK
jgi:hypothetical protein